LLAHIDQQIAEAEDLASQPILADDEQEYVAVQLTLRRQWRERVAVRRMVALEQITFIHSHREHRVHREE
jgi:hypothetical protein